MNYKLIFIVLFFVFGDAWAVDCFVNGGKKASVVFEGGGVDINCIDDYKIKAVSKFKNNVVRESVFVGDTPYFEAAKITEGEFMLLVPSSSNNHQLFIFDVKDKNVATVLNDVGRIAAVQNNGEIVIDQYVPNGVSYLIYRKINKKFVALYKISSGDNLAGYCKYTDVRNNVPIKSGVLISKLKRYCDGDAFEKSSILVGGENL